MLEPDRLAWLVSLEGVGSAYAATRDGIDAMLRDRGLRRTSAEQTGEALLRGAHASAALAGSSSTLAQVREGLGDEVANASVRISAEVLGLTPVFQRSPLQALARLDVLAGGTGRPATDLAAQRLQGLADAVTTTKIPALVVAALVHADVLTTHAFADTSGLVARAAERLILIARGVDPASLVVPEAGHLALRPEYESNLAAYATSRPEGLHAWLLYAAEAYTAGAEASPLRDRT